MGLNIYFYKTNNKSCNIDDVYRLDNKANQDRVHKRFSKYVSLLNDLQKVNQDAYVNEYINLINYLKKNAYFDFWVDGLLVNNTPKKTTKELEKWYKDRYFSIKQKMCYHKVYFLYDFFRENEEIINENKCWCSKKSIQKLIDLCESVAKGTMSDLYLDFPYYCETREFKVKLLKDIIKRFKRLLRGLKDDEKVYAIFDF